MPRGVHEVEHIVHAVLRLVRDGYRLALDGDPALPFDVHVVEISVMEIPVGNKPGALDEPVRQG